MYSVLQVTVENIWQRKEKGGGASGWNGEEFCSS